LGLLSVFGFQVYQMGRNIYQNQVDSPHMHSTYFKDVEDKVKEEYEKAHRIDQREWYQAEDDSHLKDQVKPNLLRPEYQKQKKAQSSS
jgi:hypothetical protein